MGLQLFPGGLGAQGSEHHVCFVYMYTHSMVQVVFFFNLVVNINYAERVNCVTAKEDMPLNFLRALNCYMKGSYLSLSR
jgi:hypothetical protein